MTSRLVPSRSAATWRPLGGSARRMAPAPPVLATLTRSVGAAAAAAGSDEAGAGGAQVGSGGRAGGAAAGSDEGGAGGPELSSGGSAATGVGRKWGVLSENTARGLKLAMSLA